MQLGWLKKVIEQFKPYCFESEPDNDFDSDNFEEELLLNSPMIERLSVLSRINPMDINNKAEVKKELGESICCLINGLDHKRIHFDNNQDETAFIQMLFVCYQLVTQIKKFLVAGVLEEAETE